MNDSVKPSGVTSRDEWFLRLQEVAGRVVRWHYRHDTPHAMEDMVALRAVLDAGPSDDLADFGPGCDLLDRNALWSAVDKHSPGPVTVDVITYRKLVAAYDYWLSRART